MGNEHRSILISYEDVDMENIGLDAPWRSDGACINMKLPRENINIQNYENSGWETAIENKEDVTVLFFDAGLSAENYLPISQFKNLRQLYIFGANNLHDISFVSNLLCLHQLCIEESCVSDLTPLKELLCSQKEMRHSLEKGDTFGRLRYSLEDLAITDSHLSDLSPLCGCKTYLGECILTGNQITDLSPLNQISCYHVVLSHNQISSIDDFVMHHRGSYEMDLSYNQIESVECIKESTYGISRLYLRENPADLSVIPEELKEQMLIYYDF